MVVGSAASAHILLVAAAAIPEMLGMMPFMGLDAGTVLGTVVGAYL